MNLRKLFKPSDRRLRFRPATLRSAVRRERRIALAIALLGLFLASTVCSCTMRQITEVSPEHFPDAQVCHECHGSIYREWASSAHALAYSNPRFREATDDYRFVQCLGCHAPEARVTIQTPTVRKTSLQSGVTCVSCHMEEGKMIGPLVPSGFLPHPVKTDSRRYQRSDICGPCHEGTLRQWQTAADKDKPTCQQCHMPAVYRKMTQATGGITNLFVAVERPAAQRRHSLELAPKDMPAAPIVVELTRSGNQACLSVCNKIPHNLPTGDFGMRVVKVQVSVPNVAGKVEPLGQWELTRSANGAIPPGGRRQWTFPLPAGVRSVHVTLIRLGPDNADTRILLDREVTVP